MYTQVAYQALKVVTEERGPDTALAARSQLVRGSGRPRNAIWARGPARRLFRGDAPRLGKGLGRKIKLIPGFAFTDERNFDEIRRVVNDSLQPIA
jgi:hypothetical protein